MNPLFRELWSPYLAGAGIGILVCLSFLVSKRGIGCSTAYARTMGMIEGLVGTKDPRRRAYYQLFAPEIEWEWMLVVGVVVGALASSLLSGSFAPETVPALWSQRFGGGAALRFLAALLGGALMGFGARMAGGCTSGHGISGTAQLALGSWLAFVMFFAGGVAAAFLLFGGL